MLRVLSVDLLMQKSSPIDFGYFLFLKTVWVKHNVVILRLTIIIYPLRGSRKTFPFIIKNWYLKFSREEIWLIHYWCFQFVIFVVRSINKCIFLFQVNGFLSYNDKITDGFYHILGMNPYLWLMCNELEEGRRMPSLMALKQVEPTDTSMEVVLIDQCGDS